MFSEHKYFDKFIHIKNLSFIKGARERERENESEQEKENVNEFLIQSFTHTKHVRKMIQFI